MKDPQKESGDNELNQNTPNVNPEISSDATENQKGNVEDEPVSRIQDDAGTGLFDLGVAIGGTGGGVIGNDNPGRNKQDIGQIQEE
jgi:hypothetical protein